MSSLVDRSRSNTDAQPFRASELGLRSQAEFGLGAGTPLHSRCGARRGRQPSVVHVNDNHERRDGSNRLREEARNAVECIAELQKIVGLAAPASVVTGRVKETLVERQTGFGCCACDWTEGPWHPRAPCGPALFVGARLT